VALVALFGFRRVDRGGSAGGNWRWASRLTNADVGWRLTQAEELQQTGDGAWFGLGSHANTLRAEPFLSRKPARGDVASPGVLTPPL
jgi:hypothetical protein